MKELLSLCRRGYTNVQQRIALKTKIILCILIGRRKITRDYFSIIQKLPLISGWIQFKILISRPQRPPVSV